MPNPTYTPAQLADEVQTLAENYRSTFVDFNNISDAVDYCNAGAEAYHSKVEGLEAEIAEDNGIFEDISEAIQSKTGQVDPYDKDELASTISNEWVQPTLITKQITENGTYTAEDDNADGYSEVTVEVPDESKDILNSLIDRSVTTITSDATSIGDYAFYNCAALTEVNFPKVTSIGGYAFGGCRALTEVNFPEATSIGSNAFYYCAALTEVNFPKVTSIGGNAFQNCTPLTEVNFPKATSIEYNAFRGCGALTEVNFPKVTSIGSGAFANCTGLQYFDMSEVSRVPSISSNTFQGTTCIFLFRDQTQLDEYASATNWSALASRFQIKGATS